MNYNERLYHSLPSREDTSVQDVCPVCGSYEGDSQDCPECGWDASRQHLYVKPQFLIDDDDEYQEMLERSYVNNDLDHD